MKNIIQVSLITTFRCNAKCQMCDTWKYPTKPSEELEAKYYEKLPEGLRINVTGGEPTLREDIDEIFSILYPKSYLLELSTNGYFTDKIVSLAEKYPNILIRVSVEGLPVLNDRLRGTKDGFDHALRTILELKKTRCKNIGFSIVISDKNIDDLINVYNLCCYLGVELGNSVIHNSWYFHKTDNVLQDREKATRLEKEFIKVLLQSPRYGILNKLKDFGRAYFNKSILQRFEGVACDYRPPCGAGKNFFFVDPWGNISPCNGSDEEWIIGNLKDDSFENIMNSKKAKETIEKVNRCKKDCCFIVTDRQEMIRNPWKPIRWVLENKIRLYFKLPIKI